MHLPVDRTGVNWLFLDLNAFFASCEQPADPVAETLRAVAGLAADDRFAKAYATRLRVMVYGVAPDFVTGLKSVSALADNLRTADRPWG